jgi:serine phosphatase RsbU (regulator of sigma subunit)
MVLLYRKIIAAMEPAPMSFHFSIFMLPPFLSLAIGLLLAVIAVAKGKRSRENILFALVCVWTSVPLSLAFLLHFLVPDVDSIMRIERVVHLFYVFIGFVTITFYHLILGVRRRWLEFLLLGLSLAFAVLSQTGYYFTGLYTYPWGHIAKGGPAFQAFGVYGLAVMIYGVVLCIQRLKIEPNPVTRTKIKYILLSIDVMVILTALNIPAMCGVDFYPFGNFMFVPLLVMAYGVLRYRLLDIKSIAYLTFSWIVVSSLVLIPNYLVFIAVAPFIRSGSDFAVALAVALWFFANFEYWRWIQPLINRVFNRQKVDLVAAEALFIEEIALLKSLDGLLSQLKFTLIKDLHLGFVSVSLRVGESDEYAEEGRPPLALSPEAKEFLLASNGILEKGLVEVDPGFASTREHLLPLFAASGASALAPLSQNGAVLGLLFLGEKANLKPLNAAEIRFIEDVRSATATALSNSLLYQDLSDLKDGLEKTVRERTRELTTRNEQMLFELKIASRVQMALLPRELPAGDKLHIVARMIPLMEVSGDFYEVLPLGADRTLAAVIDVSGHGVPAALLTSVIKPALERAAEKGSSTGSIAESLNASLYPLLSDTEFYFTMFLCVVDTAAMSIEYTNCGHTEPILQRGGGFGKLNTDGVFIGLAEDSRYGAKRARLERGDRLFVYSDGLTEARDPGGTEFGGQGLLRSIASTASLPVASQVKAIMDEVDAFRDKGAEARKDDITLMIIEID